MRLKTDINSLEKDLNRSCLLHNDHCAFSTDTHKLKYLLCSEKQVLKAGLYRYRLHTNLVNSFYKNSHKKCKINLRKLQNLKIIDFFNP